MVSRFGQAIVAEPQFLQFLRQVAPVVLYQMPSIAATASVTLNRHAGGPGSRVINARCELSRITSSVTNCFLDEAVGCLFYLEHEAAGFG
jgi:hypothetical protein